MLCVVKMDSIRNVLFKYNFESQKEEYGRGTMIEEKDQRTSY